MCSVPYRVQFWRHHADRTAQTTLALRLAGDLGGAPAGLRRWGGLLNAVAILLFLTNTAVAMLLQRRAARSGGSAALTEADPSATASTAAASRP